MSELRVVVAGAAGHMGQQILKAVSQAGGLVVHGALEGPGHPDLGQDAGVLAGLKPLGVALTDDPLPLLAHAQVLIDFTVPRVSVALAAQARIVDVIGTTGLSEDDDTKIRAAARHAAIVKSGNMSLGINVLARL